MLTMMVTEIFRIVVLYIVQIQVLDIVLTNDDCDDTDAAINPTQPEFIYYVDLDGDGYGDVNDLEGTVFLFESRRI